MSLSERLYRFLLRCVPRPPGDTAAIEMQEVFADAYRAARADRRAFWRLRLWAATLPDLFITVLALRRARRPRSVRRPSHYPTFPAPRAMYDTLLHDLRFALRALRRQPALTTVVALTLALGIGANTAVFSIVHTVLLAPLDYTDPQSLVLLHETDSDGGQMSLAYDNFLDWKQRNHVFSQIGAFRHDSALLAGEDPEMITVLDASAGLLPMLGVEPVLGRLFTAEEDRIGGPDVAVLTYGFWQRHFDGDPEILGKTIVLDGADHVVIGVLRAGFPQPPIGTAVELLLPLSVNAADYAGSRGRHPGIYAVGRLAPGVSLQAARDEMDGIALQLQQEYPGSNGGLGAFVAPLHETVVEDARPTLLTVWAAVGAVLLIACINVAGLLVARGAARQREIAVRMAMGARRGQVIRQLLTESLVLSAAGGGVGLLLAVWGTRGLISIYPGYLPRLDATAIDATVLGFTVLLSLGAGVVAGLVPAFEASRPDPHRMLRQAGTGAGSVAPGWARRPLLVVQFALSLVLLIGAGMLVRSLRNVLSEGPGFDPSGLLAAQIALPSNTYADNAAQAAFFAELVERVRALPGVESAATIGSLPLGGRRGGFSFYLIEGEPEVDTSRQRPIIDFSEAGPGIFRTMGIPLRRGREFTAADTRDGIQVAIVDERFADRYMSGGDPIGRRIKLGSMVADSPVPWMEVVGVAGNVVSQDVTEESAPMVYVPVAQAYRPNVLSLVVRSASSLDAISGQVRAAIREIDPNLPVLNTDSVEAYLDRSNAPQRFAAWLVGGFAVAAVLLAALGVYGVTAFYVARRTQEIGLRMALGARAGDVVRLVTSEWSVVAALGTGLGVVGALGATRLVASVLYQVSPTDLTSFVSGAAILLAAVFFASLLPARRAARIDPLEALRRE